MGTNAARKDRYIAKLYQEVAEKDDKIERLEQTCHLLQTLLNDQTRETAQVKVQLDEMAKTLREVTQQMRELEAETTRLKQPGGAVKSTVNTIPDCSSRCQRRSCVSWVQLLATKEQKDILEDEHRALTSWNRQLTIDLLEEKTYSGLLNSLSGRRGQELVTPSNKLSDEGPGLDEVKGEADLDAHEFERSRGRGETYQDILAASALSRSSRRLSTASDTTLVPSSPRHSLAYTSTKYPKIVVDLAMTTTGKQRYEGVSPSVMPSIWS